ncbi:MAG: hypothetical protein R2750_12830 [Bacteroidales bacterium]
MALNFALENPYRVDKLVVVDISTREYPGRQEHLEIIQAMRSVDFDNISSRDEVDKIISACIQSDKIRLFILKNLYRISQNRYAWRLNLDGIYESIENVFEGVRSPFTFEKKHFLLKEEIRIIFRMRTKLKSGKISQRQICCN